MGVWYPGWSLRWLTMSSDFNWDSVSSSFNASPGMACKLFLPWCFPQTWHWVGWWGRGSTHFRCEVDEKQQCHILANISVSQSFLLCYCLFEGLSPLHTLHRIFSLCVLCSILSPPFPHSELLFNLSSWNLASSCFIALFKIRASGYSPFTYKTDSQIILLKK